MPDTKIRSFLSFFIIASLSWIQLCASTSSKQKMQVLLKPSYYRHVPTVATPRTSSRCLFCWRNIGSIRNFKKKNAFNLVGKPRPPLAHVHGNQSFVRFNSIAPPLTSNDRDEIYSELQKLSSQLREHDYLYYTPGLEPKISDEEYDALAEREAELCKKYPDLLQKLEVESGLGSKASRYGGRVGPVMENTAIIDRAGLDLYTGKRTHLESAPMLSLENAMSTLQVVKWINKVKKSLMKTNKEDEDDIERVIDIIAEPKLDGLSLSLRYRLVDKMNGLYKLEWGATRGDGTRGEDVTESVHEISVIPKEVTLSKFDFDLPLMFEVRGEVILPISKFAELSRRIQTVEPEDLDVGNTAPSVLHSRQAQFSNARNAASGILMRRKTETIEENKITKMLRSYLSFYAYSIVFHSEDNKNIDASFYSNGIMMRNILTEMGFLCPEPFLTHSIVLHNEQDVTDIDCQALLEYHDKLMKQRNKEIDIEQTEEFDFEIDGAVYKISNVGDRYTLGASSRFPRWAIAHKFPSQCAITRLKGVEIQVGRTGALTPVAILDPVELGGVTVSRASLHNFEFAQSVLKATKINTENVFVGVPVGASVMISRAGDVIPQVLQRLDDMEEVDDNNRNIISLVAPTECPACGSKTVYDLVHGRESRTVPTDETIESRSRKDVEVASDGKKEVMGQVLRCSGPPLLCKPRAVGALVHAFSRAGLDIQGLSEARLQQLVDEGLIRIPADIFNILDDDGSFFQKVKAMNGWGEKSVLNLQSAVRKLTKDGVPFSRFLYSLGIRHIGVYSSSIIASVYSSPDEFFAAIDLASMSDTDSHSTNGNATTTSFADLEDNVKGIGPVIMESLISFSKNKELVEAAKDLAKKVLILESKIPSKQLHLQTSNQSIITNEVLLPFQNKSVVFTGSIPGNMSRSEAQNFVISVLGAKSTPASVSKSTGIVIVGENSGKKLEKAKDLGVQLMTAEEFLEIVKKFK